MMCGYYYKKSGGQTCNQVFVHRSCIISFLYYKLYIFLESRIFLMKLYNRFNSLTENIQ